MSNIVEAEYQIVQDRTLPVIISEIKIIEQNTARTVLENGIQIGQRLQEAKEQVGHGHFGQWCEENLSYSQDTANKFMKLAREYGDGNGILANSATSRNFSISNALSLLKVPEEDREQFIEEHQVEDMTNKELEDEIRKLKEEKETKDVIIGQLHKEIEYNKQGILQAIHETEDLKRQLADMESRSADPEEMKKLKAKLKKETERADRQTKRLKEEKSGRHAEVAKAVEEQKEELRKKAMEEASAELNEVRLARDDLQVENTALKRKLDNAGNESIVKFKILVDQLQDIFDQAGQCILVEPDQERSDKMNAALKQVVEKFKEEL